MLARLSTIFAQQKALVTRLSQPLPMTPDDINVVRGPPLHNEAPGMHAMLELLPRRRPLTAAGRSCSSGCRPQSGSARPQHLRHQ